MKKFITDYLNIIIYCILGLVLMIASFYLSINYYHSEEVKTTIYVSDTDAKYLNYKHIIALIYFEIIINLYLINNINIIEKYKIIIDKYDK